jgi:hypothetical protein
MKYSGNLEKMKGILENRDVSYTLHLGNEDIDMNALLDKKIKVVFNNKINCIICGKETRKSYGQGFCYQCFTTAPEADECVLHPDRCRAHLGISRDPQWSENHCLQPHIVYLAQSGGLKVGVTRLSQVPVRWIDQGATSAIKVCETPNRHIAGVIESFLMKYYADKTNWKKMITNESLPDINLPAEKRNAADKLPVELKQYVFSDDDQVFGVNYPVLVWPENPIQFNFDKNLVVEGVLKGVRGQYLLFDNQNVLNIRRFSGYHVELSSLDDVNDSTEHRNQ